MYIYIYTYIYIYAHGEVPQLVVFFFGGSEGGGGGVRRIRMIFSWNLFWGPLVLGNYHLYKYIYIYICICITGNCKKVMAMQKCTVTQLSCKNPKGKGLRARDEFSPLCIETLNSGDL